MSRPSFIHQAVPISLPELLASLRFVLLGTLCLPFCSMTAVAQTTTPRDGSPALTAMQAAFSAGNAVMQIQLSGTAVWHTGGTTESGSVVLNASAKGASSMLLNLQESGTRSETQDSIGSAMSCQWSNGSKPVQSSDAMNCWKPVVWFMPMLSLQPGSLPVGVSVADYGLQSDQSSTVEHLQTQLVLLDLSAEMTPQVATASTVDLKLDPTSMLPTKLSYQLHPDSGTPVAIAVEVRFSNYQRVNGVLLPFLIQRYVSNALQLEIAIQSVQIN